jgi:terminase, large subunit
MTWSPKINAPDGLRPEQIGGLSLSVRRALGVLRVEKPLRLSQWAEQHFYLSQESSYVEGRWRSWPFQRGLMDMMGHDEIHHVTIAKSARVGYTKMLLAYVCYVAEHKRRNGVVYQPTDDDRDDFVTGELEPVLRDVKVMRRVMPRFTRRNKDNTLRKKRFTTGSLYLRGGKAAKNYRRLTCDFVVYDEFSGFDRDIEKEGSPGKLGDKRTEGATWPKSIAGSTPKLKHNDNTEDRETDADAHMRWHVPCAHCGELHQITFGGPDKKHGLKWLGRDSAFVAHACPHCGGLMTQSQYLEVWHAGVWIDQASGMWLDAYGDFRTAAALDWRFVELEHQRDPVTIAPPPGHVAARVWTACAPQAAWSAIVDEFLAAMALAERGDKSLLKTFVNTTLGESWEEKGESTDEHALQKRAEPYSMGTVPIGAMVLTAGVDVQNNRWEINVWGWGRGMESWIVDDHVIEGNPADERDWAQVELYLRRRYKQAWHGGTLGIEATSIDSGHHTQAVYHFVRQQQTRMRVHAIKGSSDEGRPIKGTASPVEVNWRGQRWAHGLKLWVIGVDSAKDLLHGQLAIEQPGPGYVHFSQALPREWYEQLTAEQRVPMKVGGGSVMRWIKRRPRNEKLDCRNYATHSAYMLGVDRWSDAKWLQIENAVQPPPDLFNMGTLPLADAAPPVQTRAPDAAVLLQPPPRRLGPVAAGREW